MPNSQYILIYLQSDFVSCIVWYIFRTLPIIANSDIVRHIHVLLRHLESCVTLAIQNPAIFRILAFLESKIYSELKHILAYSERCVTLAYREPCHIQNFAIFRILADLGPKVYSECCLYQHIQAYSGIFDNGSCNINFLFFIL